MSIKNRLEKLETQLAPAQPEAEIVVILPSEQEGYCIVRQGGQDTLLTHEEADAQYPGARVILPLDEPGKVNIPG